MYYLKSEKGANFVEISIALPIFLFIVLFAIDLIRYGYLQSAARDTLTNAATWASHAGTVSGVRNNRLLINSKIIEVGLSKGLVIDRKNLAICSIKTKSCDPTEDLLPGEFFSIRLTEPIKQTTAFGFTRNLNVIVTGRLSDA